ncbi:MAG: MurR/RpiR family transcriptional regulator [Clostridiales bacterium]|nr:MurR/RpiR family transcriptional regulator [Clostridiales bacterium]
MEKSAILYKMDSLEGIFSASDHKIADYIRANERDIIRLSIVEFAEICDTAEATIVRFCKKLGFNGYQDFKISLAQELNDPIERIFEEASKEDSAADIFSKEISSIVGTLDYTKRVLDQKNLQAVAELIRAARKVYFFGSGNSASVALDAAHKMVRAGIDSAAYTDSHMQQIHAATMRPGDVAVGISHSGSSRCVVDALASARERGAATVCMCTYGKSPITRVADYPLFTASEEVKYRVLSLSSRIAQLALIDALYIWVSIHREDQALDTMQSIEKALEKTKY